jgi:small-conductance mechanosensitive channel
LQTDGRWLCHRPSAYIDSPRHNGPLGRTAEGAVVWLSMQTAGLSAPRRSRANWVKRRSVGIRVNPAPVARDGRASPGPQGHPRRCALHLGGQATPHGSRLRPRVRAQAAALAQEQPEQEGFFFQAPDQRIRLLFFTQENAVKRLLTGALVLILIVLRWAARGLSRLLSRGVDSENVRFWTSQAINLAFTFLLLLGVLSIWFDDPTRLATGLGLVTAGLAFGLQKVITAVAGYFVVLSRRHVQRRDRITMGGVRGDVIRLGFIKTTIREMGQPPSVQAAEPAQWVKSRQHTGRVVTVTNDKVFDQAVYNYTRDFPYSWEEPTLPVAYRDDRQRAEQLLLHVARRHTVARDDLTAEALEAMRSRYFVRDVRLLAHHRQLP